MILLTNKDKIDIWIILILFVRKARTVSIMLLQMYVTNRFYMLHNKTYEQTFPFLNFQIGRFINKMIHNIDGRSFIISSYNRILWSKGIPKFYLC